MTEKNLNTLIADAFALNLRHPIATIAKKTGEDKIKVNAYILGRKRPTKLFLIRFYTAFKKDLAAIGIYRALSDRHNGKPPPSRPLHDDAASRKIIGLLDRNNELTNRLFEQTKILESKIDELLKWNKHVNQLWEKN